MTKQQENRAFAKMLKEFLNVFGRVSFRERLMLRIVFDYVVEEIIADLEKENKDLKDQLTKKSDTNHSLVEQMAKLEEENAELKDESDFYHREKGEYKADFLHQVLLTNRVNRQLTKAKEIILRLYNAGRDVLMCRAEEKAYDNLENAINDRSIEQFLEKVK